MHFQTDHAPPGILHAKCFLMGPSVSLHEVQRLDHAQAENNQRAPESTPDTILKVISTWDAAGPRP